MRKRKNGVVETGVDISPVSGDIDNASLTPKEKQKAFEEAYKKQNPEKYETKKANFPLLVGVIALALIIAGFGVVKAYDSYNAPKVVVEGDYIEAQSPQVIQDYIQPEENLGAISDATNLPSIVCTGGGCTATISGSFQNATTTIVSFPSPFKKATSTATDVVIKGTTNSGYGYTSATSTVDMVRLEVTGVATSTFSVDCGVSATDGTNGASTPTVELLSTATNSIATSSKGILENNLTAALGGMVDAGTIAKVTLNPNYPYFTCLVTSVYTGAFTEATNTFDGKFTVTVHKAK